MRATRTTRKSRTKYITTTNQQRIKQCAVRFPRFRLLPLKYHYIECVCVWSSDLAKLFYLVDKNLGMTVAMRPESRKQLYIDDVVRSLSLCACCIDSLWVCLQLTRHEPAWHSQGQHAAWEWKQRCPRSLLESGHRLSRQSFLEVLVFFPPWSMYLGYIVAIFLFIFWCIWMFLSMVTHLDSAVVIAGGSLDGFVWGWRSDLGHYVQL